jgi:two-component system response regulator YesN
MYDVLVVDDEPAARKSLEYLLDWEKYGFQITAEASNGAAALEIMKHQSFSLVISDIRMPTVDGLELAARIREMSDIPIIILSGYEDFEYAQRALRMGVQDYLVKPVEPDDLVKKLQEVKEDIDKKVLLYQRMYHALPIVRDQWLRHWAHGVSEDDSNLGKLELSVPNLKTDCYTLMLIELDFLEYGKYQQWDSNLRLQRFAVRNVAEDFCEKTGLLFEESDLRFGLIWLAEEPLKEEALRHHAEALRDTVLKYARVNVTIAIGHPVQQFQALVQSYLSALKALESNPLPNREAILIGSGWDWNREPEAIQTIEKVKEIARQQYKQNINLRLISKDIYMNPAYLGQLFKSYEGISFQQYLLQLRMEKAKQLLLQTNKKVYEIAAEVGYRELDWFYKKFKDFEGKSPGEFREVEGNKGE